MTIRRHALLLLSCFVILSGAHAHAKETQAKDALGRDYWVYTPDTIDPDKTYTLVVGVHGYRGNGKGAAGYAGWVNTRDVIVLGPSYPNDGYQYLQKDSDQQTVDLIKQLRKDYKLNEKIFIAGFSGGAQYAHRFAMKYPDLVAGCAAHSGGTWATGDYAERAVPNLKARGVLFVISCGENDTKKSFDEAPMGRLEWAKKYETMLKDGGFIYDARWWPGVGHSQSKGARQMTEDCFIASTQVLPAYEAERTAIGEALRQRDVAGAWALIKARLDDAAAKDDGILGKVHQLYVESLADDIARADRLAEREVAKALREQGDAGQRRAALEALKTTYAGAPQTTRAIAKALAELE